MSAEPSAAADRADAVYLSPHLDDAILSCGGRIARECAAGERIVVLTLFTADEPATPPSPFATTLARWWNLPPGEVMRARRREDLEACARLACHAEHAGLVEAPYRLDAAGRPLYTSLEALFGAVAEADEPLVERLVARLAGIETGRLVAPLGVGGHVDHRLARRAAERARPDALFYEEFPYTEWKWRAVDRALGRRADWRAETIQLTDVELVARREAIECYRSQVPALFRTPARLAKQLRRALRRAGGERLWRPLSPSPSPAR